MKNLPESWVAKIFSELSGLYGAQFRSKFSQIENGVDVGIKMAMVAWSKELGGFVDHPDAIAYALNHLPTEHAPNALEFRDICRRAPRKSEAVAAIEYKPTAEDITRQRELSHKVAEAVRPKEFDGLLWAKRPKSQKAMDFIADGKKHASRFHALAEVFDQLVMDGIANESGKLLHRWDGVAWVKS